MQSSSPASRPAPEHQRGEGGPLAVLAAALAAPGLSPLAGSNASDDERGERVGPPPARERVREQSYKERDRQVAAVCVCEASFTVADELSL